MAVLDERRELAWWPTNAPTSSAWTADIWFADHRTGWAVNASGQILHTKDGGNRWDQQALIPDAWLSCIAFAGRRVGWTGTLTPERRLFHTTDRGSSWNEVKNLPAVPSRVTGIAALDEATAVVAGSSESDDQAAIARTSDRGQSWTVTDMSHHAAALDDIQFVDLHHGLAIGRRRVAGRGAGETGNETLIATILRTVDSGATWHDALSDASHLARPDEVPRRLFVTRSGWVAVSLSHPGHGAILRSDDAGRTWQRLPVAQQNRLDGIALDDAGRGWLGGWGNATFVGGYILTTSDAGQSWVRAGEGGQRATRFRMIEAPAPTAFAAGDTIYRLGAAPLERPAATGAERALRAVEATSRALIKIDVPDQARCVTVRVWSRSGRIVRTLLCDNSPQSGTQTISWDMRDDARRTVPIGVYFARIVIDQCSESRLIFKSA